MSERRPTPDQHARELLGLPPEWTVMCWEAVGPWKDRSGLKLTGAVMPEVFKSGPRKGRPNWRKRDLATEVTITIPDALHRAWIAQWEIDTGKCSNCAGSGQEWAGWSASEGSKTKPCQTCGASGLAKHVRTEVTP